MYFTPDSLLPENQPPLMITVAPFGQQWGSSDNPSNVAIYLKGQVQSAVDCYNAGATVLHIPVCDSELGERSRAVDQYSAFIGMLRQAVPRMVLQIGCPISPTAEFVKEADQYGDDINHTLAEIDPKPDQVTVTIGTTVMNSLTIDVAAEPIVGQAPASLSLELFKNLRTNGIQPYFEMAHACQLDDLEQLIRAGAYQGPVNHLLTATGGSRFFGRNPFDFIEYVRRSPPGSMMTMESNGRTGAPFAAMSIALGVHARCGIKEKPEDWQGERKSLVQQVSQIARLAKELKRPVASGQQAREMSQLGVCYDSTEETLDALGLPPNPKNGQAGFFVKDGRPGGTPTRSERRN